VDGVHHGLDPGGLPGDAVAQPVPKGPQAQVHGRQRLDGVVVDVGGDAGPFVVLGLDEAFGQRALAGLGERPQLAERQRRPPDHEHAGGQREDRGDRADPGEAAVEQQPEDGEAAGAGQDQDGDPLQVHRA
jgi:hypothetical protein